MNEQKTILMWLTNHFPQAKKTTLRAMVAEKRVRLNGVPVKSLKQTVVSADKIDVSDTVGGPTGVIAEGIEILYQDADIIIIDKPAGVLTSTTSDEPRPTVVAVLNEYVQNHNQKAQALLIHRLDKDASGLLVFARTANAFNKLKKQFADHTITREYTVVVHGIFRKPSGRLEMRLYEDERGRVHSTKDDRRGKLAILEFQTIAASPTPPGLTLLKCRLFTGRKHQIRVQLKAIGHPVCGDVLYGTREAQSSKEPPFRLALHASHLEFVHPKSGKPVVFDSPAPSSFAKLVTP